MTALFNQTKKILVERFGIDEQKIQLSADLQKELNLDSMDAIDLLLSINETFSIRIPEQALEKIHTVEQLLAVIAHYRPKM